MAQFTTAEETALAEPYLQCDLSPAKRPDFALVISGHPIIYTYATTYALASGSHNLSTTNGFTTSYAWIAKDGIEIASSKLKEAMPEGGGFSIGNATVEVLDRFGESTITRDLTELVSRQAFREGNVTGSEYTLGAALTKSGTSITLVSTTGLSNGGTIWIGSEAIKIGTVASSTSLTGCTRGYLLTNAVPHENAVTVYGYLPALKGRPFWIYKGYQDLALSEWLPMWGGTIEHVGRSEPGVVRFSGKPTEWEMWGGTASGLRPAAPSLVNAPRAPSHGVRRIVRLGQINDDVDENVFMTTAVEMYGGDYLSIAVQAGTLFDQIGDGHFALKFGDYWFGIYSITSLPGGIASVNIVKGLVNGGYPDLIESGSTLDLAWTNATYTATAAPTGTDPIDLLLYFLTSTGTGDNGAYDTYKKGIGLGIAVERIDLASFTEVQGHYDYDDATKVFFLFPESTHAKPFFDAELCKPFGWYVSTGNDGRIKLVRPKNPTKLYFSRANNEFTFFHPSNPTRLRRYALPAGVYTPEECAAALQTGFRNATGDAGIVASWSAGTFSISAAANGHSFSWSVSDAYRTIGVTAGGTLSQITSDTAVGVFTSTSFNTITENDVLTGSPSQNGEAPQIGLVNFGCNYNWNEDRFDYKVFVDAETANLAPYGEAPAYEIASKGLIRAFGTNGHRPNSPMRVMLPPTGSGCEGTPAEVSSSVGIDNIGSGAALFCSHLFDRYRNPPIRFKCRLKWKFNTKEIGDCLLWNYTPKGVFLDQELARDYFQDRVFEIVGIRPMPTQGCVEVDLLGHRDSGAVV